MSVKNNIFTQAEILNNSELMDKGSMKTARQEHLTFDDKLS
jgi:hypothetical protein